MEQLYTATFHYNNCSPSAHSPAGTRRDNNVFITSKRRRRRRFDVMKTLSLRHYCVMCPLGDISGISHAYMGLLPYT